MIGLDIIAAKLEAAGGEVPLPELLEAIDYRNVNAAVSDLRRAGYVIACRVEGGAGHKKRVWYRLVSKPEKMRS